MGIFCIIDAIPNYTKHVLKIVCISTSQLRSPAFIHLIKSEIVCYIISSSSKRIPGLYTRQKKTQFLSTEKYESISLRFVRNLWQSPNVHCRWTRMAIWMQQQQGRKKNSHQGFGMQILPSSAIANAIVSSHIVRKSRIAASPLPNKIISKKSKCLRGKGITQSQRYVTCSASLFTTGTMALICARSLATKLTTRP